MTSNNYR